MQQQYQQPAQQSYQQPMYNQPAAASAGGGLSSVTNMLQGIPLRLIAKIAFLLALVCFLFPFVSVSCDTSTLAAMSGEDSANMEFEIEYKGYNLIFPSTISAKNLKTSDDDINGELENIEEEAEEDGGEEYGSEEESNIWLILTAICCIAGCVIMFLKINKLLPLISAGCALFGTISLFIFKSGFRDRYLKSDLTEMEGMDISSYLKVNFKFGFILCLIMVIIALISSALTFFSEKDT